MDKRKPCFELEDHSSCLHHERGLDVRGSFVMNKNKNNAFSNLIVLDMTRYLPGGYATQPFADWGANVIKVEDTGQGDFCRHDAPTRFGVSYYSTALCRNKKSVSLNLKDAVAKEYFLELAAKADVIIESFRPGVTTRLGIDYETIKKINSRIVYVSISAFGQKDERSLKAYHDLNMQALTGYTSLADDDAFPLSLVDLAAGMVAGQAMLAALLNRTTTDEGAYIDISMTDCFVWWQSLIDSRWCFNGKVHTRGDHERPSVGYNLYETKDGKMLAFALLEQKFWVPFVHEVGIPELEAHCLKRKWQAPWAFEVMENLVKGKTLAEWEEWLSDKEYSISSVPSKKEAIERMLADGSEMLSYVDFPDVGRVLQTNIPHRISTLSTKIKEFREASRLGQDTEEILLELGASSQEIQQLFERGAVKLDSPVDKSIVDDNPVAP